MSKKSASFPSSVIDNNFGAYFDMEKGMWCMCAFYGHVSVINGRPFTTGKCIEHNSSASHNIKVEQYEHMEKIKAYKSSKGV